MATYCLIIKLNKNSKIEIGKKGAISFKKGYYVYIGSALNSLERRIKRHFSSKKKLFWHIDYLLNSHDSKIEEGVFERTNQKWECEIAKEISTDGLPVNGFGCSDCKCKAHLFYFENFEHAESACVESFNKFKLNMEILKE